MERFVTDPPLKLAPITAAREFTRTDVVFYGVQHKGSSFEALIFLNSPDASIETPREFEHGFAGSFVIFGHGGCFGDEGHCEVPAGPRDPFDSRPPHGLTPQTTLVDVTEALKRSAGDTLTISVLATVRGEQATAQLADVLFFTELRLLSYR